MAASSRDLLRAQIAAALSKSAVRPIEFAGVSGFVRGLTGGERVQLQQWIAEGGPAVQDFRVAALGLCDADGVRLFDDPEQLRDQAYPDNVLRKVALAVLEASGLTSDAAEAAAGN